MKQVILDVETTGLNERRNGIIQLSGIIITDGAYRESFDFRCKPLPQDDIDEKALAVSGLDRMVIQKYQSPYDAKRQFTELLKQYIDPYDRSDKALFIGYNAVFDWRFLYTWFQKLGDNFFGSYFFYPPIDVAVLAGEHLKAKRSGMKNFKLNTAAEHVGIKVNQDRLHDSMYDVELTWELYLQITKQ